MTKRYEYHGFCEKLLYLTPLRSFSQVIRTNYLRDKFLLYCVVSLPFDTINVAGFKCVSEGLTCLSMVKILRFPLMSTWASMLNVSDSWRDFQERHPQSLRLFEVRVSEEQETREGARSE